MSFFIPVGWIGVPNPPAVYKLGNYMTIWEKILRVVKMLINNSDDVTVIDDDGEYEELPYEVP